jgi:hypothetical protein
MPTTAGATVTAAQMISRGENHQAILEIKITGQNFLRRRRSFSLTMKLHHAMDANAGLIAGFRR